MAFTTARLQCDLLADTEQDEFCGLLTSAKVMRQIAPVLTLPQAQAKFRAAIKYNQAETLRQRIWHIRDRNTNAFYGIQSLQWRDGEAHQAEIGIMLAPQANQKGVAIEAMDGLLGFAFSYFGLERVYAHFYQTHRATRKLVARLGYHIVDAAQSIDRVPQSYCFITATMYRSDRKCAESA